MYKAIRSSCTKSNSQTMDGFKNILAHIKESGKENDAQRHFIERLFTNYKFEETINNLYNEEKTDQEQEFLEKLTYIFEKENANVGNNSFNKWVIFILLFYYKKILVFFIEF